MALEFDQAGIVRVGPAEIKFLRSALFPFLNHLPEQQRHSPQFMEPAIRATVLVNERFLEEQSEDAGDGLTVLRYNVDSSLITHALEQVPKPGARLRRKLMAAPREQEEPIELLQKRFRVPLLINQVFTFRALNLPLHATLVEVAIQSLQLRAQIKGMKMKLGALAEPSPLQRERAFLGRSEGEVSGCERVRGLRTAAVETPLLI
jgi:hypothetical protein